MEEIKLQSKILSEEDRMVVKSLTEELIVGALNLCDELVSCNWDKSLDGSRFPAGSSERLLEKSNRSYETCFCCSISLHGECDCQETNLSKSCHRPLQHTQTEAEYLKHFDPLGGYVDVVPVVDEILGTTANNPPTEQMKTFKEFLGNSCKVAGMLEVEKHDDELDAISEVQIAFEALGESETLDRLDEGDGFPKNIMPDSMCKEMKDETLTKHSLSSDSNGLFVYASTDSGIVMSVSSKTLDTDFLDSLSDIVCTCQNCLTDNSTFDSVNSQTTKTIKNTLNTLGSCSSTELITDHIVGNSATGDSVKSELLMNECLYVDSGGVGRIPIEETAHVLNGSGDVGIMAIGLDTSYYSIPFAHISDMSTKIELNIGNSDEDSGVAAGSEFDIMSNDLSSSCLGTLSDVESCKEAPVKTRSFVSSLQYVKEKPKRDDRGRLMSRSHSLKVGGFISFD